MKEHKRRMPFHAGDKVVCTYRHSWITSGIESGRTFTAKQMPDEHTICVEEVNGYFQSFWFELAEPVSQEGNK